MTFFKKLGIMALAFMNRALYSILQVLIWLDQGLGLLIAVPFYLLLGTPVPNADETISSVVGRFATDGHWWALAAEWIIDRLFYPIEGSLGHCRREIEYEDVDWEPR